MQGHKSNTKTASKVNHAGPPALAPGPEMQTERHCENHGGTVAHGFSFGEIEKKQVGNKVWQEETVEQGWSNAGTRPNPLDKMTFCDYASHFFHAANGTQSGPVMQHYLRNSKALNTSNSTGANMMAAASHGSATH